MERAPNNKFVAPVSVNAQNFAGVKDGLFGSGKVEGWNVFIVLNEYKVADKVCYFFN